MRFGGGSIISGWLALALAAPAAGLTIDGFGSPPGGQSVVILPLGGNPATASDSAGGLGADALGGERDLAITRTAGGLLASFTANVNAGGSGSFAHSQGLGVSGLSQLSWDGADGDAASLDPLGLGGIDLTLGGHDAFALELLSISAAATLTIEVFTDGISSSSHSLGVSSAGTVLFAYADFAGSADFADVGAIRLTLDGSASPGLDATLGSFVTVPDPSSALLLAGGLLLLAFGGRRRSAG